MELRDVATGILLDCDVLVTVDRVKDQRLNGIGLEVTFVPVTGNREHKTRTSRLFIRRKQAEELFELLREALKKPEGRTLN